MCRQLNKSLESLTTQNVDSIEIIAIDNASEDNSLKSIEEFANQYGNMKIISLKTRTSRYQAIKTEVLAASGKKDVSNG